MSEKEYLRGLEDAFEMVLAEFQTKDEAQVREYVTQCLQRLKEEKMCRINDLIENP